MRILLVHPGPDWSVHDVFTGWMEALRELGVEVAAYNTNDRLVFYSRCLVDTGEQDEDGHAIVTQALNDRQAKTLAFQGLSHACYTFWPDVIVFISGFFTTAAQFELFRQRDHKIVILHTESPYQDEEQLMRGEMADLNILNDPANLELFRELGPAEYIPHAYRPGLHRPRTGPRDPDLSADLAFIGTAFKSRVKFLLDMDLSGLDVLLGGSDWAQQLPEDSPLRKYLANDADTCVDNDEAVRVYQSARCGLNLYRKEREDGTQWGVNWPGGGRTRAGAVTYEAQAMGPREVELAATGLPFLRDPRPEGDEVLHMLPRFRSPGEAGEQLRWLLAHELEREEMARQAREAIQDRTFASNAKRLLKLLEDL
jgi:spore maturation protein CgeB